MRRRKLLFGMIATVSGVAGCTSLEEDDPTLSSTLQITDPLCDESEGQAEIDQQSESTISVAGIIENVPEGSCIKSTLYGPSEEDAIICQIQVRESADETVECSGSVNYSLEISYENIDLSEISILHYTADERAYIADLSL